MSQTQPLIMPSFVDATLMLQEPLNTSSSSTSSSSSAVGSTSVSVSSSSSSTSTSHLGHKVLVEIPSASEVAKAAAAAAMAQMAHQQQQLQTATTTTTTAGNTTSNASTTTGPNRPRRRKPQPENWKKNRQKRERAMSHQMGPECGCKKLQCFAKILPEDREMLLHVFNDLASYNAQQQFLSALIETQEVASPVRRSYLNNPLTTILDVRPSVSSGNSTVQPIIHSGHTTPTDYPAMPSLSTADSVEMEPPAVKQVLRKYCAKYFVKVHNLRMQVCLRAFCALFGISPRRVGILTAKLHNNGFGVAPTDMRGKHANFGTMKAAASSQQLTA